MKKLLIAILLFTGFNLKAQVRPGLPADQKYEYFLNIHGVSGKPDIKVIETSFRGKAGVTFFQTNKQDHKYFILRSSTPITQQQVEGWLNGTSYTLADFAADEKTKEELIKRLR
jgi:hypothetical protein